MTLVAALALSVAVGLLAAPLAHADDRCNGPLGSCSRPEPWNGQLMPTWNTPGFYGGWTNTPVICNQFTMQCRGYADQPN